jgi:hypothetical protein
MNRKEKLFIIYLVSRLWAASLSIGITMKSRQLEVIISERDYN